MVKKRVNLDNEDLWNIVTKTIIPKKSDKISPVDFLIGDPSKAKQKLGWIPKYDFNSLVKEMMDSDLRLMKVKFKN